MSTTTSITDLFRPTRTVQPWEVALERRDGEPTRVLPPGRHRTRRRATYQSVDVREQITTVPAQEVLTADGITAKVSAVFVWSIADAVLHTEKVRDPVGTVYLAIQLGLRDALVAMEAEALVRAPRSGLAAGVREHAAGPAAEVGIRLHDVVVKDVVLPLDLRAAYAELVVGRQRAQAQLEAARAETAALRSLANGAKLLDDHPSLAQLRLVQALPPGSRVDLVQPGRAADRRSD